MALNILYCADVPLSSYSLTHPTFIILSCNKTQNGDLVLANPGPLYRTRHDMMELTNCMDRILNIILLLLLELVV